MTYLARNDNDVQHNRVQVSVWAVSAARGAGDGSVSRGPRRHKAKALRIRMLSDQSHSSILMDSFWMLG